MLTNFNVLDLGNSRISQLWLSDNRHWVEVGVERELDMGSILACFLLKEVDFVCPSLDFLLGRELERSYLTVVVSLS